MMETQLGFKQGIPDIMGTNVEGNNTFKDLDEERIDGAVVYKLTIATEVNFWKLNGWVLMGSTERIYSRQIFSVSSIEQYISFWKCKY